jgi:hypothetical protein
MALVVITDGRPYLWETLASLSLVAPPFAHSILVDDSGCTAAESVYGSFERVVTHEHRQGLAAAVRSGWEAADELGADFIFHLEDDWTFVTRPELQRMADVLTLEPHLSQISLKRQPWNPTEVAAGGFVEVNPDAYSPVARGVVSWTEHRVCFSLNPCVIPRRIFERGWPTGNEAEQTYNLNDDPANRFAIWGTKFDPPCVHHIGVTRSPQWAL